MLADISVFFGLFRALAYFLMCIYYGRRIHEARHLIALAHISKAPARKYQEDLIFYIGLSMMFAGLTIGSLTLQFNPMALHAYSNTVSPGTIITLIMLLIRMPRWWQKEEKKK